IPLSFAAILGGMCTLIGTSTNLVVHGMMLDAGFEGFSMFELGKVGAFIATAGTLYMIFFASKRLPEANGTESVEHPVRDEENRIVEAVLGPRFPGINRTFQEFDFRTHYGADIREIRRGGVIMPDPKSLSFREGDTLVLDTDDSFIRTWGDSSVFLMLSNGKEHKSSCPPWKKWLALALLTLMIAGATFGNLPSVQRVLPGIRSDMFFWVAIVTVLMAIFGIFPAKKYTKFISWDILVTIASALAISRAMTNSGLANCIAEHLIALSGNVSPWVVLAVLYVVTNLTTELITNNAAAAFAFPIALSAAELLGVNPMPFFVTICIAASASFSSPIGYQTNMIVQGIGNYRFRDFVRAGLPLNLIAFTLTMALVPLFWQF
ncbi:MAG: SLC13 family permease, partial [Alistipes sp.]|nr:SLC13 family permease [Alistipes sp.]